MTTASISLVDALGRYRLLETAQLEEVARTLQAGFPDAKALAGELIRRGWLTPYQANQLLLGRGQELLLGSYVLLERLGEGGMGQVFKARNWKLGRIVALKLIRKERLDNSDAIRRFQREVRSAAALSHPNIVHAHDADQVGGAHLLVVEYVEGTDLAKLVKKYGALPVERACEYVRQAALGLQHAHDRGLVHRDVKPANLLLTADGKTVKVLDMGLARLDQSADDDKSTTLTQEGVVMGTPNYIAPEQALESHTVDFRADIYSLGCTFYFLLAGNVPFPGGSLAEKLLHHQLHEPRPVEQMRHEVPPAVAAVVRKMMAKRPEDRFQTLAEVAAVLASSGETSQEVAGEWAGLEEENTVEAPTSVKSMQPARPGSGTTMGPASLRRRWPRLAVGAVLMLLVGVGLLFILKGRPGRLVVKVPEGNVQLWIDGEAKASVDASKVGRLEAPAGEHKLTVKQGAEELYTEIVTVQSGREVVIEAKWTPKRFTNGLGMEFVVVPRGKSWLGGGGGKPGDKEVAISYDFYLGKYEVTQEEWEKLMGANPSQFKTVAGVKEEDQKRFPVENVSWEEAQRFLGLVNDKEKEAGYVYRLPKEVEWEYACRGGPLSNQSQSAFDFYLDRPTNQITAKQANIDDGNGLKRTCKVGSRQPNALGLYDMHGNVWEWCDDADGSDRVYRSGSWKAVSWDCRAATRNRSGSSARFSTLGLRLARVPVGK